MFLVLDIELSSLVIFLTERKLIAANLSCMQNICGAFVEQTVEVIERFIAINSKKIMCNCFCKETQKRIVCGFFIFLLKRDSENCEDSLNSMKNIYKIFFT